MGYYRITVKREEGDKLLLVGSGSVRKGEDNKLRIGRGLSYADIKLPSSSGPKRLMHLMFRVSRESHLMVLAYSPAEGELEDGEWVDVPEGSWVQCGKRLRFCDEDSFYQIQANWWADRVYR